MKLTHITPAVVCSLALIVGCAKTEDEPQPAKNAPSTQPVAVVTPVTASATTAPAEPTASMMLINGTAQWFPPARLRLSSEKGKGRRAALQRRSERCFDRQGNGQFL